MEGFVFLFFVLDETGGASPTCYILITDKNEFMYKKIKVKKQETKKATTIEICSSHSLIDGNYFAFTRWITDNHCDLILEFCFAMLY